MSTPLGHRWYDSATGRFVSRDPAQDGSNWYDYAGNDPLGFVDPDGLQLGQIGTRHDLRKPPSWFPGEAPSAAPSAIGSLMKLPLIVLLTLLPESTADSDMMPGFNNPLPHGHPLNSPLPPLPGWVWRGPDEPGGRRGSWVNLETGERLHGHSADSDHEDHWDYIDRLGWEWRIDAKTGKKTRKEYRGVPKKRGRNRRKKEEPPNQ